MQKSGFVLASILAFCAAGVYGQVTPVATGLNNPRGLAFGPDCILYVGEAGLGAGDGAGGAAFGVGPTGSVGEIRGLCTGNPTYTRLVTGLSSSDDPGGVVGPDGVSPLGNGNINVIMAESSTAIGADNPDAPDAVIAQFGKLLQVSQGGNWKTVASVGDFNYAWAAENANQPWAPVGQFPDANPYAVLSVPGHEYVADAGANTIDEVSKNGTVRIIAYVPNPLLPFGPNGALVPVSDSVPTCVALGPDGFLYVGTLAFGANFATHTPQSKVYRFDPNRSNIFLGTADEWATGFNPITGCGFSGGSFYATEFNSSIPGTLGHVVKVELTSSGAPGTRTILGGNQLIAPNGFAAGPDGSIYVSNHSVFPGVNEGGPVGEVVRVDY